MKKAERFESLEHCLTVICDGPVLEELSHANLKFAVRKMFWVASGLGQTAKQSTTLEDHVAEVVDLAKTTREVITERKSNS